MQQPDKFYFGNHYVGSIFDIYKIESTVEDYQKQYQEASAKKKAALF